VETIRSGGFAILHLGRDVEEANSAITRLADLTNEPFGVAFVCDLGQDLVELPANVTKIVLPYGLKVAVSGAEDAETLYQVRSADEAEDAIKKGATAIVLKGHEGSGKVGQESSFILFQKVIARCQEADVKVYIQGGAGVHTGAAYLNLGAAGLLFDSQVALMPESSAPKALTETLAKLSGTETHLIGDYRVLKWPTAPKVAEDAPFSEVEPYLNGLDLEANLIPLGMDFALAGEYVVRYARLNLFIHAIMEATYGHLRQAQHLAAIRKEAPFATDLGVTYPVIQGPMARVSDVPAFLSDVADGGALPFLAMGMAGGEESAQMLKASHEALDGRPWGVGILGFIHPHTVEEQTHLILALDPKPTAVVIAGGRPTQAKHFEKNDIAAFLHVPSPALLDMYLKEGARRFIFEGRESGGHVGPLDSTVIWEKQIFHLLADEDPLSLYVVFAGGIHDALTSAFVSIMAASLAARGIKVGVTLGTAYLFTEEAVSSGAITANFQEQALKASSTVLLESSPGQETRALATPFTEWFTTEKKRILAMDLDTIAQRTALEELNVGRARIATKGLDRADGKVEVTDDNVAKAFGDDATQEVSAVKKGSLVEVPVADQIERGLYMVGSITGVIDKARTIEQLHETVTTSAGEVVSGLEQVVEMRPAASVQKVRSGDGYRPSDEPIAIVGLAGVFPQAQTADEYWRNILGGVDSITEVPPERWDPEVFYDPELGKLDSTLSKWGGFIHGVEFDPIEYGVPPTSVPSIDAGQLIGLQVAKRAMQDAGYTDFKSAVYDNVTVLFGSASQGELSQRYGSRIGLKALLGQLPDEVSDQLPKPTEDSFPGVLTNVVSGRVTNRLNMAGRNFTVDAACASSLATLDVGCRELWDDRANVVIVGGVDFHNSVIDYVMFSATYAFSPRGFCATFDESGDGTTVGEAVAAIVLKRLSDAERDGDRVYALIRGVEGSSDGRALGLTAPNLAGQFKAVKRAWRLAGILPSELGLVEAHGTGTSVGDRTELGAISNAMFDGGALPGQAYAGSVKSMIGHTKATAGVAGVIRAALSIYHGIIPPTLHLENPVRSYHEGISPLIFNANDTAKLWNSQRRVASVSGFGFGGTNFHAILENYKPELPEGPTCRSWADELFLFRGKDAEAAKAMMGKVKDLYEASHYLFLKDVAYSLATHSEDDVQYAIVAGTWEELLQRIDAVLEGPAKAPGLFQRDAKDGKVAFLFSGQGSQRVNMAKDLFVMFPELRPQLDANKAYQDIMFPPSVFTEEQKAAQKAQVTDTRNAQPLLGFADLAIAQLLNEFGVAADMVAGHSYGELPALAYAGVIPADELCELSRARAEAILGVLGEDPGKMAAVSAPADKVNELLDGETEVWAVNYNSPRQTVIGGTTEGIANVLKRFSSEGVKAQEINVACAFHTPLLDGADTTFAKALKSIKFGKSSVEVWSNTTAEAYPATATAIKERLAEHLVKPVKFTDELQAMYDKGARVFIEAGPGAVLTGLAKDSLPSDVVTIQTESRNGLSTFLAALGKYATTGRSIDLEKLFGGRAVVKLDLDHPEKHKQSATTWMLNGQGAVKAAQWREQGDKHLPQRRLTEDDFREYQRQGVGAEYGLTNPEEGKTPDEVVFTYLQNVKTLMDDQRDVMLGYLGYDTDAPRVRRPAAEDAEGEAGQEALEASAEAVEGEVVDAEDDDEEEGSGLPKATEMTKEELTDLILEVVSEKTGYPIEMLGLDMDLEADLSIDSIKRLEIMGALSERVEMPEFDDEEEMSEDDQAAMLERLASIKTLRGMIDWIEEVAKEFEAYQKEMEAQGIDLENLTEEQRAQQRAEIQARMRAQAEGIDYNSLSEEEKSERRSRLEDQFKTSIEGVEDKDEIERLAREQLAEVRPEDISAEELRAAMAGRGPKLQTNMITEDVAEIARMIVSYQDFPLSEDNEELTGKKVLITDDGTELTQKVKAALEAEGAVVTLVTETAEDMKELEGIDSMVLLNSSTSPNTYSIRDLFNMCKAVDFKTLGSAYVFDDVVGAIYDDQNLAGIADIQGFSGLMKTLLQEYPDPRFRVIHTGQKFSIETLPTMVVNELKNKTLFPEIMYMEERRLRLVPQVLKRDEERPDELPPTDGGSAKSLPDLLDKDSVVMAVGGAQGISPSLMAGVAKAVGSHFVLVGRSPRNQEDAEKYAEFSERPALQRHLITVEGMRNPKEVTARVNSIFKAKHIEDALTKVGEYAASVEYVTCDIRDADSFRAVCDDVKKRHGHLDGMFDAAAHIEDKYFRDKDWDSFERVYTTKTTILQVVGELVQDLKLLVLFGSLSASIGNVGQGDYAAGNSVYDMVTFVLDRLAVPVKAVTMSWGPWAGGLMTDAVAKELRRRGLSLMQLDLGAQFVVDELTDGHDANIMAAAGYGDDIKQFIEFSLAAVS
jgi:acyl transferase domain-containing protein/NAD(P)H-dependent flavin oxidoreductase YrpB (nitropropane dioxygenase family)